MGHSLGLFFWRFKERLLRKWETQSWMCPRKMGFPRVRASSEVLVWASHWTSNKNRVRWMSLCRWAQRREQELLHPVVLTGKPQISSWGSSPWGFGTASWLWQILACLSLESQSDLVLKTATIFVLSVWNPYFGNVGATSLML